MKRTLLIICLAFLGSSLFAQTSVWKNEGAEANWNFVEGWTEGVPTADTKTVFNVPAGSDCIIDTDDAIVKQLVIGDNDPYGGTLIVKDGGVLTCTQEWSTVGYNEGGLMVIEKGGAVVVTGDRFHVGLVDPKAEGIEVSLEIAGTITTPKFTVNDGGKAWDASCYVTAGGLIDTDIFWIGEGGLVDVTGGTIKIAGDQIEAIAAFATTGQLTAEGGAQDPVVEVKIVGADTTTWVTSGTTVGIYDYMEKATLSVYPNPAKSMVSLGVMANDVTIFNLAGQVALKARNTDRINIENLKPAGGHCHGTGELK